MILCLAKACVRIIAEAILMEAISEGDLIRDTPQYWVCRHHIKNWGTSTTHRCRRGDSDSGYFLRRLLLRRILGGLTVSSNNASLVPRFSVSRLALYMHRSFRLSIPCYDSVIAVRTVRNNAGSHWEILMEFARCA
jgi:hypothetical protein